jgi:hypothetical protein
MCLTIPRSLFDRTELLDVLCKTPLAKTDEFVDGAVLNARCRAASDSARSECLRLTHVSPAASR